MSAYLKAVPHGQAVLVATQRRTKKAMDRSKAALRTMGASIFSPDLDTSYTLIGKSGSFGITELSWQRLKVSMFKRDSDQFPTPMEGCLTAKENSVIIEECTDKDIAQMWNYRNSFLISGLDGRCVDLNDFAIGTVL